MNKIKKYGVYVEIDTNQWMWDSGTQQISPAEPPLLFDTEEAAQAYSDKKWKTGRALEYPEYLKKHWRAEMIGENDYGEREECGRQPTTEQPTTTRDEKTSD